jgi:hypothetical protein
MADAPKKNVKKKAAETTDTPAPKKKKKVKRKPAVDLTGSVASKFLMETCDAARSEYGDANIAAAGEAGRIVCGIPLPCLAMEYLIQNDVWPLGRFAQVVGTEGTCKSAFTFEMARWFKESEGIAYLFENETKYSPDFALSIIGYPDNPEEESLLHLPCNSVEDWQEKIQRVADWCRTKMDPGPKKKGLGRVFPVLLILDSLMGKLSVETQSAIDKVGHAGRAFPLEALQINGFLKKFPQDLEEWPMFFVAVNHLKPQKSATGPHMERNKAGGRAPSFQQTFEIELKRGKSANIHLVDPEGFEIGGLNLVIACKKNSLGETDRKIKCAIKWVYRGHPITGDTVQYTKWDWPAATTDLLTGFKEGHRAAKIKEVVDIHGSGNKLWSKTLGVSSKDPMTPHDLGVLIERNEPIKKELRRLMGIKNRKHFVTGVDYLDQLQELKDNVHTRLGDQRG